MKSIYLELRQLARARMASTHVGVSTGPGEVTRESSSSDRAHFFVAAAEAMRRVQELPCSGRRADDALSTAGSMDGALAALDKKDEHLALIVKLHYFVGLSIEEIAGLLGFPERTVNRDWASARAWLRLRMRPAESS